MLVKNLNKNNPIKNNLNLHKANEIITNQNNKSNNNNPLDNKNITILAKPINKKDLINFLSNRLIDDNNKENDFHKILHFNQTNDDKNNILLNFIGDTEYIGRFVNLPQKTTIVSLKNQEQYLKTDTAVVFDHPNSPIPLKDRKFTQPDYENLILDYLVKLINIKENQDVKVRYVNNKLSNDNVDIIDFNKLDKSNIYYLTDWYEYLEQPFIIINLYVHFGIADILKFSTKKDYLYKLFMKAINKDGYTTTIKYKDKKTNFTKIKTHTIKLEQLRKLNLKTIVQNKDNKNEKLKKHNQYINTWITIEINGINYRLLLALTDISGYQSSLHKNYSLANLPILDDKGIYHRGNYKETPKGKIHISRTDLAYYEDHELLKKYAINDLHLYEVDININILTKNLIKKLGLSNYYNMDKAIPLTVGSIVVDTIIKPTIKQTLEIIQPLIELDKLKKNEVINNLNLLIKDVKNNKLTCVNELNNLHDLFNNDLEFRIFDKKEFAKNKDKRTADLSLIHDDDLYIKNKEFQIILKNYIKNFSNIDNKKLLKDLKKIKIHIQLKYLRTIDYSNNFANVNFFKENSIKNLSNIYLAIVNGGRCYNCQPTKLYFNGVLLDLDQAQAYGTVLRSLYKVIGNPTLLIKDNNPIKLKDFLTKEILKEFKDPKNKQFFLMNISSKNFIKNEDSNYRYSFKTDFFISNNETKIEKLLIGDNESLQNLDINKKEVSTYLKCIKNANVGFYGLKFILEIFSKKELNEFLENTYVNSCAFYEPKNRTTDPIKFKEMIDNGNQHACLVIDVGIKVTNLIESRIKLKKLLNEIIKKNKHLNENEIKQLKEYVQTNIEQEFDKLIINTIYGTECSQHFETSTPIIANYITEATRFFNYLAEKCNKGIQLITDGTVVDINKVFKRVKNNNRYRPLSSNLLANIENQKYRNNYIYVDTLFDHVVEPPIKNGNEFYFIVNSKEYNTQEFKTLASNQYLENMKQFYYDIDIDFLNDPKIKDFYKFEVKELCKEMVITGVANNYKVLFDNKIIHSYINKQDENKLKNQFITKDDNNFDDLKNLIKKTIYVNLDDLKQRGFISKDSFEYIALFKKDIELLNQNNNPIRSMYQSLKDQPTNAKEPIFYLITSLLKLNEFTNNLDKYISRNMDLSCNFFKTIKPSLFSLSSYNFLDPIQEKSFSKQHNVIKFKSGYGIEKIAFNIEKKTFDIKNLIILIFNLIDNEYLKINIFDKKQANLIQKHLNISFNELKKRWSYIDPFYLIRNIFKNPKIYIKRTLDYDLGITINIDYSSNSDKKDYKFLFTNIKTLNIEFLFFYSEEYKLFIYIENRNKVNKKDSKYLKNIVLNDLNLNGIEITNLNDLLNISNQDINKKYRKKTLKNKRL